MSRRTEPASDANAQLADHLLECGLFDHPPESADPRVGLDALFDLGLAWVHFADVTSEPMRDILGECVLGLPAEVRVDRDVPWNQLLRN